MTATGGDFDEDNKTGQVRVRLRNVPRVPWVWIIFFYMIKGKRPYGSLNGNHSTSPKSTNNISRVTDALLFEKNEASSF